MINYNLKGIAIVITFEAIDFYLLSKRELSKMFSFVGGAVDQLVLAKQDTGLQFVIEESKLSCFQEYKDASSIDSLINTFYKVLGLFPKLNLRAFGTNYDAVIQVGDQESARRLQLTLSIRDPDLLKNVFKSEPVSAGFQAFFKSSDKDYDISFAPVQTDPKQILVHYHTHRNTNALPAQEDLLNIMTEEITFVKYSVDELLGQANV